MGFDFDALVFYGFVVTTAHSESDLWQAGSDVVVGEGVIERFQRRLGAIAPNSSAPNSSAPNSATLAIHEVGIGLRCDEGLPTGPVYVYVRESVTMGSMGRAGTLDFEVSSSWPEKVRQFCVLMEIPWQEPAWHWFGTAS
ncbi:MAG: hypothetical protein AB4042_13750 [Leptolyngbyaceae cyanobacterium]